MNKPLCIVSCPIDVYSGYGRRSVDFLKTLINIKGEEWNIQILSQRWGSCQYGYLKDHNEHDLISRIIPQLTQQPDYWFQITIASEFQPVGSKFSCGVTAGIESTVCDPSWIEGISKMNLTLVSSEHAKNVFLNSKFEKRNQQGQIEGVLEVKNPNTIQTLFEGLDTSIFHKIDELPKGDVKEIIDLIPEEFCFLFTGHYLQGVLGEDRKDVGMLVKTFLETFKDKKQKPALILKTSGATYSVMDREEITDRVEKIRQQVKGDLPNIYVLHGELSDSEMNELYNHSKIKAMVSFTKGEGFGRPLLEFSVSQKPVIVSNWSGHLDFLKHSILLPGEVKQIHPSAAVKGILIPESGWFTVNYKEASNVLEDVYKNYSKKLEKAKQQAYLSKTEFSLDKMQERLKQIFDQFVPNYKPLKLPELSKISLPKLRKIN